MLFFGLELMLLSKGRDAQPITLCVCANTCGHDNPSQRPVLTVKYTCITKMVITLFSFYNQSQRDRRILSHVYLRLFVFTNRRFGWLVDRWLVRRSDSLCESKKRAIMSKIYLRIKIKPI